MSPPFSRTSSSRFPRVARPFIAAAVIGAGVAVGCSTPAPPPRVAVPLSPDEGAPKTYPQLRPLREPTAQELVPPPAFDDTPLVSQAVPEEPAYVGAYDRVGQPRVVVFVNRTIEGQIIPVDERRTIAGIEVTRDTNAAVDIEHARDRSDRWRDDSRSDHFKTDGPAHIRETAEVYLAPGQYDEVQAKALDYQAIELALADTLSASGKVTLVSPMMVRQRLTDEEVKDLQSGRPQVLREIAEKLDADVLIQAQARPTKQTAEGLQVRILVEAINTHGGESVARAFVDVPPPLEKTTINRYTRFLARKTMAGLANTWSRMATTPAPEQRRESTRLTTPPAAPVAPRSQPPTTQP